ncbi:MAG: DapH/DapD/GlmU-related protein [Bacteroidia bacterium]
MIRLSKGSIECGANVKIAPTVIFLRGDNMGGEVAKVRIGSGSIIRDGTIIYEGVTLGQNVIIDHNCIVREFCVIADNTRLMNNSELGREIKIGENSRISGFLANRSLVGNNTSMFGSLLHTNKKHGGGLIETSPRIGSNVMIGKQSLIIGAVEVKDGMKIRAGSIVTEKTIVLDPYFLERFFKRV